MYVDEQAGDAVQPADGKKKRKIVGAVEKGKSKKSKVSTVPSPLTGRNLDVNLEFISGPTSPTQAAQVQTTQLTMQLVGEGVHHPQVHSLPAQTELAPHQSPSPIHIPEQSDMSVLTLRLRLSLRLSKTLIYYFKSSMKFLTAQHLTV